MAFYDRCATYTAPIDSIPKGASRDRFVEVTTPAPTCCRSELYDWAICYRVPGNLRNLSSRMPDHCDAHKRP